MAVLAPIPGRDCRTLRLAVFTMAKIFALCLSWFSILHMDLSSRAWVMVGGGGRVERLERKGTERATTPFSAVCTTPTYYTGVLPLAPPEAIPAQTQRCHGSPDLPLHHGGPPHRPLCRRRGRDGPVWGRFGKNPRGPPGAEDQGGRVHVDAHVSRHLHGGLLGSATGGLP